MAPRNRHDGLEGENVSTKSDDYYYSIVPTKSHGAAEVGGTKEAHLSISDTYMLRRIMLVVLHARLSLLTADALGVKEILVALSHSSASHHLAFFVLFWSLYLD